MAYVVIRNSTGAEVGRLSVDGPTIVGRATECEISLPDARLSRLHCRIDSENDAWTLTDLDSKNGTFVNDHRIEKFLLHDSDVFQIADWRLTFHTGASPPKRPQNPLHIEPTLPAPLSSDDEPGDTHQALTVPATKDGSTVNGVAPLAFQRPPAAPKLAPPSVSAAPPKRRRYVLPIIVFIFGVMAMAALYWYIFTH